MHRIRRRAGRGRWLPTALPMPAPNPIAQDTAAEFMRPVARLDIDLAVESIRDPDAFPLVSQANG